MRISATRWEGIDPEEMNLVFQKLTCFVNQSAKCISTGLVPRRDDLDHCHDSVITNVQHDNGTLFSSVELRISLRSKCCTGVNEHSRSTATSSFRLRIKSLFDRSTRRRLKS